MKTCRLLFITLLFIIITLSCEKKNDSEYFRGNLVGFVKLVDEFGAESQDKSGVEVQILNHSYHATTNNYGRFEMSNLKAGTYNISFNKPQYGTHKLFNYQFVGGNVPAVINEITLYKFPEIEVRQMDIEFVNNKINISGTFAEERNEYEISIFLNDSANVSNLHHDYNWSTTGFCCISVSGFSRSIELDRTHYREGDVIYMVVYLLNPNDNGYWDSEKKQTVFSSYKKATEVIELTLE